MLFESQHVTRKHHGKKQPIKVIHVVQGMLNVSAHSSHCTSPSGSCDSSQHQAFKTWLHPQRIYNDPASKTSLSLIIRAVKRLWGQLLKPERAGAFAAMHAAAITHQSQIQAVSFSISSECIIWVIKTCTFALVRMFLQRISMCMAFLWLQRVFLLTFQCNANAENALPTDMRIIRILQIHF